MLLPRNGNRICKEIESGGAMRTYCVGYFLISLLEYKVLAHRKRDVYDYLPKQAISDRTDVNE